MKKHNYIKGSDDGYLFMKILEQSQEILDDINIRQMIFEKTRYKLQMDTFHMDILDRLYQEDDI